MFERIPRAADVSPWSGVGGAVSVSVGIATTVLFGTAVTGTGAAGAITAGICNSAAVVVVMVIVINGGAVTAAIDIIDDCSTVISVRDTLPLLRLLLFLSLAMVMVLPLVLFVPLLLLLSSLLP